MKFSQKIVEEWEDMAQVENSEIQRLLRMKGNSRIWVPNDTSNFILSIDYYEFPGIGHQFLESKKYTTEEGEWFEHKLLLRGFKDSDTPEYLSYLINTLSKLISRLDIKGVESIGLEDIDFNSKYYYFLIYLISDGKDKPKEED